MTGDNFVSSAAREVGHKMNPASNWKNILIIIYISEQKLFFLSGKSSMDVESYIFSVFSLFNEPHFMPKSKARFIPFYNLVYTGDISWKLPWNKILVRTLII